MNISSTDKAHFEDDFHQITNKPKQIIGKATEGVRGSSPGKYILKKPARNRWFFEVPSGIEPL